MAHPWGATRNSVEMPDLLHRASRFLARKTFSFWQKLGLHLTYVHFYEPVPDTRALDDAIWNRDSELPGIDLNPGLQIQLLEKFAEQNRAAWTNLAQRPRACTPGQFALGNEYFDSADAEILYAMIRRFKPRRIYEIGSGYSTLLVEEAIAENRKENPACVSEHVAIDPFPADFLCTRTNGLSLWPERIQDIPLRTFEGLNKDDILFIDSSHVLTIGSDVCLEYLEILPRLNPGVLVHCHDIFMPSEYPKDWVFKHHRFWNEQYVLQAFLAFNNEFEVLWAGNYMHLKHADLLRRHIPSYRQTTCYPKSFWIRRKG